MKKLIVLFVTIFCGTLFAAAEGDAGASLPPQRISHPLTSLPIEIIQEVIFTYLSPKDQEAFRSVNSEASCIPPRALTFNMSTVQDHEISEVSTFLADRKDIKTLKIIRLKAPLLIPALTSLQDGGFRFSALTDLDLGHNQNVIPVLYNIMPLAPNLMGLSVNGCDLGAGDAHAICHMMPHLRDLNIGANNIGPTGAVAIAQMLELRTLDIRSNFIRVPGAVAISQMPHLRTLNISSNEIGTAEAVAIAQMPLRTLHISCNGIGDPGATAIAQMINLIDLDISSNNIGPVGAGSIAQMPHLTTLNIGGNFIGVDGANTVAQMPHLTTLNIGNNSTEYTF